MDRSAKGFTDRSATARVDWAESSELLDSRILFECSSTFGGRYAAVCVYADHVVVEDPREPGGRTDLRSRDIRSWKISEHEFDIEVVFAAREVHRARLPRLFRGALALALVKALGKAPLAA